MSKMIALIDDEAEMEDIFHLVLDKYIREDLITLKYFKHTEQFLEWVKTNTPSLLLTDINMPVISGPEVIRRLKQDGRCIPTYFISGHHEKEYRKLMEELGVNRYFSKPLNFQILLDYIESDLGLVSANL